MAAKPINGWAKRHPNTWLVHLLVAGTLLLTLLAAYSRNKSSQALFESERRLTAMSKASHDALMIINSSGSITFWNPAAEKMFGYTQDEIIGKDLHELLTLPEDRRKANHNMPAFAKSGKGQVLDSVMEMQAVRKSGKVFPVERAVSSFHFNNQWFAVGSVRDITQRKKAEARLIEMATTDVLTGIANRRHYLAQSTKQFKISSRYEKSFCVLMFDLDHFKRINDSYGHNIGDRVLKVVAACMKQTLRDTDIMGRIGGEEFAVSMPETRLEQAKMVAERLRKAIATSKVDVDKSQIQFTASFGISEYSENTKSVEMLLKQADEALYQAKEQGRNRVSFFKNKQK